MDILLTCIFMSILLMVSDGLTVRGPSDPLVVPLGSSVVLPCYVDKALSSEGLEVEWRRTDSDTLVHWFLEGESRPEAQQQEYHDRAHFFTDQIQHGNFSLRLDNLTAEDEGKYTCKVYSQQDSGETVVQIKDVERLLVSGSSHSISASAGEDVTLNCSVDSHITPEHIEEVSWKRTDEDILVLLYQNNETLPDSSDEQYRDRVEFFTDEIPKGNFSLRLKSVRSEDKGVYICQVFAGGLSANATVELERLGFSSWHIIVLVFCFVAGLGAVLLLCCLIFCRSENTVTSSTIWNLQISLVFCPNLCMFFAFIFWGLTEGFLHETIFCCALYILRPVMLIWALPYLKYLQDKLKRWTKFSSVTGEYAVLTVVVYSVVFTYGWKKSAHDTDNDHRIFFGTCFGFVLLYCLILCGGFRNIKVKGTVVFLVSAPQSIQLLFSLRVPNLALTLLPWVQVILQLLMFAFFKKSYYRKCMCALLLLDMIIAIYVHIGILEVEKDFFGWTCVILFLQVLRLMVYFEQQGSNPYELENSGVQRRRQTETSQQILHAFHLCHEIMYMFGAVGLVLLNSVTLTAELILKARNGERVLKDLRVVVFSSECVFAFYFLVLHMHAYWKIDTAKFTRNQRNSDQEHRRQLRTQNTLETLM